MNNSIIGKMIYNKDVLIRLLRNKIDLRNSEHRYREYSKLNNQIKKITDEVNRITNEINRQIKNS